MTKTKRITAIILCFIMAILEVPYLDSIFTNVGKVFADTMASIYIGNDANKSWPSKIPNTNISIAKNTYFGGSDSRYNTKPSIDGEYAMVIIPSESTPATPIDNNNKKYTGSYNYWNQAKSARKQIDNDKYVQYALNDSRNNNLKLRYKNLLWYPDPNKHEFDSRRIKSGKYAGWIYLDLVVSLESRGELINWTGKNQSANGNSYPGIIRLGKLPKSGIIPVEICNVKYVKLGYKYCYPGTETTFPMTSRFTIKDIDAGQGVTFNKSMGVNLLGVEKNTNLSNYFSGDDKNIVDNTFGETDDYNQRQWVTAQFKTGYGTMVYSSGRRYEITTQPMRHYYKMRNTQKWDGSKWVTTEGFYHYKEGDKNYTKQNSPQWTSWAAHGDAWSKLGQGLKKSTTDYSWVPIQEYYDKKTVESNGDSYWKGSGKNKAKYRHQYKTVLEYRRQSKISNRTQPYGAWAHYEATPDSLIDVPEYPTPIKKVTTGKINGADDKPSNQYLVDSNTIAGKSDYFTYSITQQIPPFETAGIQARTFIIQDVLDSKCLDINAGLCKVYIYKGSPNKPDMLSATHLFDIKATPTSGDKTIVKAVYKGGDNIYNKGNGSSLRLDIPVRVKPNVTYDDLRAHGHASGDTYRFTNTASVTVDSKTKGTNTVTTTLPKPISLKVVKRDAETKQIMKKAGIRFSLKLGGSVVRTGTTNANGEVPEWKNLAAGTYDLYEDTAVEGYAKLSIPTKVTLSKYGQLETFDFYNKPTRIGIGKVRSDGKTYLPGARLRLSDAYGNIIRTWTSTTSPEIFLRLKVGQKYYVDELAAPDDFRPFARQSFTVGNTDALVEVKIKNWLKPIYDFNKVDPDANEPVLGAKLQIIDPSIPVGNPNRVVDEWISDGTTHTNKNLTTGKTYTLHEATTPVGFTQSSDKSFIIKDTMKDNEDPVTIEMEDKEETQLKVRKVALETIRYEKENLKGVNFTLTGTANFSESGRTFSKNITKHYTTDSNGEIDIKGLYVGTYYLTEDAVPAGFRAQTHRFKIVVTGRGKDGVTVTREPLQGTEGETTPATKVTASGDTIDTYEFSNEELPYADITFLKTDDMAEFKVLSNATFNLYGTTTRGKEFFDMAISGVDGKVSFMNIPDGSYTLKEIAPPMYYSQEELDNKKVRKEYILESHNGTVTLKYKEDNSEAIRASGQSPDSGLNGLYRIKNKEIPTADLDLVKKDVDGTILPGIKFKLYGIDSAANEQDMDLVSDENGEVHIRNLPKGTYKLKETELISGYEEKRTWKLDIVPDTEAYAKYTNGTLTFFRDKKGKYTNGYTSEGVIYYTGIETNTSTTPPWNSIDGSEITTVEFRDVITPKTTANWFNGFTNLTNISNLNNLDTSNVTNMRAMFRNCQNLTTLDFRSFDTSNVTNMSSMFEGCQLLQRADLSYFDTSKVTNMNFMLRNCTMLNTKLIIMKMPTNYTEMCYRDYGNNGYIQLRRTSNVSSSSIDLLVATRNTNDTRILTGGTDTPTPLEPIVKATTSITLDGVEVPMDGDKYVLENEKEKDAEIEITKVSDTGEILPNTEFTLSGVSDTGIQVNENVTADENGKIRLSEIPMGTYQLTETETPEGAEPSEGWTVTVKHSRAERKKTEEEALEGEAYAVFNSNDGTLTFFRDFAGKYDNGDVREGGLTYYTGVEDTPAPSNWNTVAVTPQDIKNFGIPWGEKCEQVKTIIFNDVIKPKQSTSQWFNRMINLDNIIGLNKLDTSNVTDMSAMFYRCWQLEELDLSSFDTRKVTNFTYFIDGGGAIEGLVSDKGYTSHDALSNGLDAGVIRIKKLDLSNFDTRNAVYMRYMFSHMHDIEHLDVSTFNTKKAVNTSGMFADMPNCKQIRVSNEWDVTNVTESTSMFYGDKKLKNYDVSTTDKTKANSSSTGYLTSSAWPAIEVSSSNVDYGSVPDYGSPLIYEVTGNDQSVETVRSYGLSASDEELEGEAYAVYDSSDNTFRFFRDLAGKYSNGEVSGTKTYYTGIENLPPAQYTSTVTTANIPWWEIKADVKKVIFEDTIRPVNSVAHFFCGMQNLEEIVDLKKLDTRNVTDMASLFDNCKKITSLDLSGFDTSKVKNMSYMFNGMSLIKELDLRTFDTSSVADDDIHGTRQQVQCMFAYCPNLETIYVSDSWDVTHLYYGGTGTSTNNMFLNSTKLKNYDANTATSAQWAHYQPGGYLTYKELLDPKYDSQNGYEIINFFRKKADVEFIKRTDDGSPLEGAVFRLHGTSKYGDPVDMTATSDENGVVTFTDVWYGDYQMNETEVPVGVVREKKPFRVTVDSAETEIVPKSKEEALAGEAYAVYDRTDKTLTFFRDDAGKYTNEQVIGTKTYFTGVESTTTSRWASELTKANVPWLDVLKTTEKVIFQDVIKPQSSTMGWFYRGEHIEEYVGLNKLDTSSVTSMYSMFDLNLSVKTLDLSSFDTSNVVTAHFMFSNCQSIKELDLRTWDTSKMVNANGLFANMHSVEKILVSDKWENNFDVGSEMFLNDAKLPNYVSTSETASNAYVVVGEAYAVFDSSDGSLTFFRDEAGKYRNNQTVGTKTYYTGIETMEPLNETHIPWSSKAANIKSVSFNNTIKPVSTAYWFYGMNNTNLKTIAGLASNLDTSDVTDMSWMFGDCSNLTSLDVSRFNTSKVTNMSHMFYNCPKITSLDVSHFDTSNVTNMSGMFMNDALVTLDLSHFNTSKVRNTSDMLYYCKNVNTTLNIMNMPNSYSGMLEGRTGTSKIITLKYVSPVTSANINTLVATKDSYDEYVVNGGQGTFTKPTAPNFAYSYLTLGEGEEPKVDYGTKEVSKSDPVNIYDNEGSRLNGEIVNPLEKKGSLKFKKTDTSGNILPGTKFRIHGKSDNDTPVDMTAISGSDGYVEFSDVFVGTYEMTELEAPDGYSPSKETWSVGINSNKHVLTLNDYGKITDANGNPTGVTYTIYEPYGQKIASTNASGEIVPESMRASQILSAIYTQGGTISVRFNDNSYEVDIPASSQNSGDSFDLDYFSTIHMSNGKEQMKKDGEYVIENKEFNMDVVLEKVDSDDSTKFLPGAQYTLSGFSDKESYVYTTAETDKDGKLTFKEVPAGTYTLKEIKAPDNYLLDEEEHEVVVKAPRTETITEEVPREVVTETEEQVSGGTLITTSPQLPTREVWFTQDYLGNSIQGQLLTALPSVNTARFLENNNSVLAGFDGNANNIALSNGFITNQGVPQLVALTNTIKAAYNNNLTFELVDENDNTLDMEIIDLQELNKNASVINANQLSQVLGSLANDFEFESQDGSIINLGIYDNFYSAYSNTEFEGLVYHDNVNGDYYNLVFVPDILYSDSGNQYCRPLLFNDTNLNPFTTEDILSDLADAIENDDKYAYHDILNTYGEKGLLTDSDGVYVFSTPFYMFAKMQGEAASVTNYAFTATSSGTYKFNLTGLKPNKSYEVQKGSSTLSFTSNANGVIEETVSLDANEQIMIKNVPSATLHNVFKKGTETTTVYDTVTRTVDHGAEITSDLEQPYKADDDQTIRAEDVWAYPVTNKFNIKKIEERFKTDEEYTVMSYRTISSEELEDEPDYVNMMLPDLDPNWVNDITFTWNNEEVESSSSTWEYVGGDIPTIRIYKTIVNGGFNVGDVASVSVPSDLPKNKTIPLEGAEFTLSGTTETGDKYKTVLESPVNGVISFEKIPNGRYVLEETKTPVVMNGEEEQEYRPVSSYFNVEAVDGNVTITNALGDILYESTEEETEDGKFFEVENEKKLPGEIGFKIRKTDSVTNEPVANAEFTIQGESQYYGTVDFSVPTNARGEASFEGIPVGEYTLTESTPPEGYYPLNINYRVVVTDDGELTVYNGEDVVAPDNEVGLPIYSFTNDPYQSFMIHKINSKDKGLEGAKFLLIDQGGETYREVTTDFSGHAEFKSLEEGTYTLIEEEAPLGYQVLPGIYDVVVTKTDVTVSLGGTELQKYADGYEFTDEDLFMDLTLNKVSPSGNPLAGATFQLFGVSDSRDAIDKRVTSGSNGVIRFTEVPLGTYTLREINPPTGYNATAEKFTVSLKYDSEFSVYTAEISGDAGTEVTPTINGNKASMSLTNYNDPPLKIKKVDSVTKAPLQDAMFTVYDEESGDTLMEVMSNADGLISLEGLSRFNTEKIRIEETNPPESYKGDPLIYHVNIDRTKDQPYTLNVEGEEDAEVDVEPITLFDGTLASQNTQSTADGNLETYTFKKNDKIIASVEDANGEVAEGIEYTITSTDISLGYVDIPIYDDEHFISVDFGSGTCHIWDDNGLQYTAPFTVYLGVNSGSLFPEKALEDIDGAKGFTVENTLQKKDFRIKKVDSDNGDAVEGAEFELIRVGSEGDEITSTSGNDGFVHFNGLLAGTYQLREKSAPTGYLLNENIYNLRVVMTEEGSPFIVTLDDSDVVLNEDQDGYYLEVENDKTYPVRFDKKELGSNKLLKDAHMFIFDQNNEIVETFITEGTTKTVYLKAGTYILNEAYPPYGYETASDITFTVGPNGVTSSALEEGIVTMYDEKITGSFSFKKVTDRGGNLPGATFQLDGTSDLGNKIHMEDISSTSGLVSFTGIELGDYVLTEKSAPDKYEKDANQYYVSVKGGYEKLGVYRYTVSGDTATITWVPKTGTETPVEGATIYIGESELTTDSNGSFVIPTGEDLTNATIIVGDDRAGSLDFTKANGEFELTGMSDPEGNTPEYGVVTTFKDDAGNDVTEISNTRNATYSDVKVDKNVTGSLGDRTKEFEFTASFTGLEPNTTYTYTKGSRGSTTTTEYSEIARYEVLEDDYEKNYIDIVIDPYDPMWNGQLKLFYNEVEVPYNPSVWDIIDNSTVRVSQNASPDYEFMDGDEIVVKAPVESETEVINRAGYKNINYTITTINVGTVDVTITDDKGNPVENAEIKMYISSNDSLAGTYTSNTSGVYRIMHGGVLPGTRIPAKTLYLTITIDGVTSEKFNDMSGALIFPAEYSTLTSNANGIAEATFKLRDDEDITFSELPDGAQYTVTETRSDHKASYRTDSGKSGANLIAAQSISTGNLKVGEDKVVHVKNERSIAIITGTQDAFSYLLLMLLIFIELAVYYKAKNKLDWYGYIEWLKGIKK